MSAARVERDGKIVRLDGKAGPAEVVTEQDAQQPSKVAKMLARLLADVAALRRAWSPRRLDFEDLVVVSPGTVTRYVEHGFGGRVWWWVIDSDTPVYVCKNVAGTTGTTLAIDVYGDGAGTFSVRVEEAG